MGQSAEKFFAATGITGKINDYCFDRVIATGLKLGERGRREQTI
jgi:hypothetical protein